MRPFGHVSRGRDPALSPVIVGVALGAYSDVLLDSGMHSDIQPFASFSPANPLLGALSPGDLHLLCVMLGLLSVLGLALRRLLAERRDAH